MPSTSAADSRVPSLRSARGSLCSAHMDLRPLTQGLALIPRAKSSSRTVTGDFSRRNSLKSDSASSVQSVADESLSLVDVENLISERVQDRKDDLKAAFEAFDQEGNKTVTKGEFRRVIEGFLVPLTESQFEGLLAKLEIRENGTVAYMEFLRRYCRISSAVDRIPRVSASYRNWSLGELQCRLKEKIGGNLKNITRAFRLFDYNSDGQIQQHELRKVLESYCFPMSQQEFHRLWSHYSPNNTHTISYKKFLEQLGVDCENYRKITPDSIKLALNWNSVSQATRPKSNTGVRTFPGKSINTLDEVQTVFLSKMKKNHDLVQKALRAFDLTGSGFVSSEDLRSVLSHFLLPMDENIFRGLLNRFGVSATEPVDWGRFLSLFKDDKETIAVQKDSPPETADINNTEAILLRLRQHILDRQLCLTEAFLNVDKNRTGVISRDELRRALENISFHLTDEQFQVLADLLDAEHVDVLSYQQLLDLLHQQRPMQTPKLIGKNSTQLNTSTPTQNAIEGILKEKLTDNYHTLMESITRVTQKHSDIISAEDLRRLIQQYGPMLSPHHFSSLCEPFLEAGGVNYKLFLKSLGIPERRSDSSNLSLSNFEREDKTHEARILNRKTQAVQDVVLRKLRDGLQRRGVTLQDCLTATGQTSTEVLSLRDFCKILDDCGVFLEGSQFQTLIESLGFNHGQISATDFVDKYEAITSEKNEEPDRTTETVQASTMLSAEDCLSQLKKKIEEHYGDILTAFRLMDKNRDGLVNRNDFRVLFDSLMFVTKEREYPKFLDLLGLTPGATLNYTEFCERVNCGGTMGPHQPKISRDGWLYNVGDQVHTHLAALAEKGSSEFSRAFSQLGEDGEGIMTKNDLKQLLFTYYLPITPKEFDKLWDRYDEEGRGVLTQTEFLRKLQVTSNEVCQSDASRNQPADRPVSVTTPDTEVTLQNLRKWIRSDFETVSGSLVVLDKNRDGHVTTTDLLSVLHRHGFQLTEAQLKDLLSLLGFDTCRKKLPYLDFLKNLAGSPGSSRSTDEGSPEPVANVEELGSERAIQRVEEMVTASSDILYKAFSVFDKTGGGTIPQAEFRHVLDHFCLRLSDVQFRKLLSRLNVREEEEMMMDWRQFLKIFNLHRKETADEWLKKVQKMRFPNQTRPLLMSDILRRIQEVLSARLYTITSEMLELDYANINSISKEDFKNICDRHFMRLNDDQFQNLWKMLPVNSFGNLEYREFLKKFTGESKGVEKVGRSLPGSARPSVDRPASLRRPKTAPCTFGRSSSLGSEQLRRPSTSSRRHTPLLNCEDVEMKIRPRIQECWRHIQRRSREMDTERMGEIDVDTFLEILEGLRIDLSPAEFEQLAVKYDIRNSGRVSYPDFLRHFVLVFGPQVNTSNYRLKLQLPRTPMRAGPLSGQCVEAMLRISKPVQLFWRQMRQRFVAFDKERTGKISLQDFRKVLRQFSVNLSEEEFFHFTSFFDNNISGKISYNDFLRIFLKLV